MVDEYVLRQVYYDDVLDIHGGDGRNRDIVAEEGHTAVAVGFVAERDAVEHDRNRRGRQQNRLGLFGGVLPQVETAHLEFRDAQAGCVTRNGRVPDGVKVHALPHEMEQSFPRERRGLPDFFGNRRGEGRDGREIAFDFGFHEPAQNVLFGIGRGRENQFGFHIAPDFFGAFQVSGHEQGRVERAHRGPRHRAHVPV